MVYTFFRHNTIACLIDYIIAQRCFYMNWEPKKKCMWLDFSWYSRYCSDLEFTQQYVLNKPVLDFVLSYLSFLLFLDSGNCQSFSFLCHILTFLFWFWLSAHLWYSLTVCFPWLLASSIHPFFCGHLLPSLHRFPVSCGLFSSTPVAYTVPSWHTNF